jgi:hypothetical protein
MPKEKHLFLIIIHFKVIWAGFVTQVQAQSSEFKTLYHQEKESKRKKKF